jgi:hypothetical protein
VPQKKRVGFHGNLEGEPTLWDQVKADHQHERLKHQLNPASFYFARYHTLAEALSRIIADDEPRKVASTKRLRKIRFFAVGREADFDSLREAVEQLLPVPPPVHVRVHPDGRCETNQRAHRERTRVLSLRSLIITLTDVYEDPAGFFRRPDFDQLRLADAIAEWGTGVLENARLQKKFRRLSPARQEALSLRAPARIATGGRPPESTPAERLIEQQIIFDAVRAEAGRLTRNHARTAQAITEVSSRTLELIGRAISPNQTLNLFNAAQSDMRRRRS